MHLARRAEILLAWIRWSLARWPRRPEMDKAPEDARGRWARFRRAGGVSGRIHDAFRRRLTPAGRILFALWFSALVVSRVPGRSLADGLFLALSAALVVSWLLSWRRIPLEATWGAPEHAVEGGRVEIEVVLRNPGRHSVADPGAGVFRYADGLDAPADGTHTAVLASGGRVILRVPMTARLRGVSHLDAPHVLVPEPLGLMRASRRLEGAAVVVVRPRRPSLEGFRFLGAGAIGAAFAAALGGAKSRTGDPSGVREFREGDSLRDLHHRSWARRGAPATRERTAPRGDGIRLHVRTRCGGRADTVALDALLGLASSVAQWLDARGALAEAWIDGERVPDGPGSLEDRVWTACGRVPRGGWGRRSEESAAALPARDGAPVLVVAMAGSAPERGPDRKSVLVDWLTESVMEEPGGAVLRVSPLLASGRRVSL